MSVDDACANERQELRSGLEEWLAAFVDFVARWPEDSGRLYIEIEQRTPDADRALVAVHCHVGAPGNGGRVQYGLNNVLPWVRRQLERDVMIVRGRNALGVEDESMAQDLISTIERAISDL